MYGCNVPNHFLASNSRGSSISANGKVGKNLNKEFLRARESKFGRTDLAP